MIDGCFVVPADVQDALAVVLERQFQLGLTVAARGCRGQMTDADYRPAADALRELMRAIDAAMCGRPANDVAERLRSSPFERPVRPCGRGVSQV